MDGKLLSAADAKALASLESREVMLSKIAGLMKSQMSKAAAMFVGAQSRFLGVLEAYKDKLPAEDVVEAAVPATEEAPATEVSTEDAPAAEEAPTGDAEEPAAEAGEQPDQSNDDTTEAEASGSEEEE
jgi:large subunit ribosomal protein L10